MNYNTNIQQQQIGRSSKYEVNTAKAPDGIQAGLESLARREKSRKVLVSGQRNFRTSWKSGKKKKKSSLRRKGEVLVELNVRRWEKCELKII